MDPIDICLAEKLKSVMATKCFHFFLQRTITDHDRVLLMGGRGRSNTVEEVSPQVPSLDPPFAVYRSLFVWFPSGGKFQSAGEQLIDA